MEKPKIFISYSHKDVEWRERLIPHLDLLKQEDGLDYWTVEEHLTVVVKEIKTTLERLTSVTRKEENREPQRETTAVLVEETTETAPPEVRVLEKKAPRIEVVPPPVPPQASIPVPPFKEITNSIGMKLAQLACASSRLRFEPGARVDGGGVRCVQ